MEFGGYPHFVDGIWKLMEIRSRNVYGALRAVLESGKVGLGVKQYRAKRISRTTEFRVLNPICALDSPEGN